MANTKTVKEKTLGTHSYAGTFWRVVAWNLDLFFIITFVFGTAALLIFVASGSAGLAEIFSALLLPETESNVRVSLFFLALVVVFIFAYFVYFEGGRHSASPAKRLMKIKVQKEDGGKAGYGLLFLRLIIVAILSTDFGGRIPVLPEIIGLLALLSALLIVFSKTKQGAT